MHLSPRRYARMVKRIGRLLTRRDVLYRYDVHPQKVTLGTVYGGWTIAPKVLSPEGIMYSFGVGTDISFDEAMIRLFQLQVHGFDPSPHIISWIRTYKLPSKYIFHPYGLAAIDGSIPFFSPERTGGMYSARSEHAGVGSIEKQLPVRKLESIVTELNTKCLEVLKVDIEGAEYGLLPSIIDCQVPIKQLLIEFHHRIGIESLQTTINAVNQLRKHGYLLFHVSETSSEFSFLNCNLVS